MWRWGWLDKTHVEIFLNEFLERFLFRCRKRVYKVNRRLSTLFKIDFEVIGTMRRENVSKFMILGGNIRQIRSFCKFCRVGLNIQRIKIEFEIVEAQKFWCIQECCSTNDSNVRSLGVKHRSPNTGMETTESDNCRGLSKRDGDVNGMLAMMWKGARFSYKDEWKFIDPFT